MAPESMVSSSENSENNADLKKLGTLSSVLLLVGACTWLTVLFSNGEVLQNALVGIAFGCLILHVLPQVILDLRYPKRPLPHSRYGTRSRWINLLQSALFAVGAFFQGACYWSWISQDDDSDYYTSLNIIGAYFWLASGFLTVLFEGCFCCERDRAETLDQRKVHRIGNSIYMAATVVLLLGAYAWKDEPNEFLGFMLQLLSILLFIAMGILYVMGDVHVDNFKGIIGCILTI
jgi:hypothetical protein